MTFGKSPRGKFVYQKVNKIRWRPPQGGRNTGTHFVTGSWDDEVNTVSLWSWPTFEADPNFGDISSEDLKGSEPERLTSFDHRFGDVNEIKFLNVDLVAVASSDGRVSLLRLIRDGPHYDDVTGWKLNQVCQWRNVHGASSCNGLSCSGDLISTVGEDGKISILNPKLTKQAVRTFTKADSCSLTGVSFIKNDEIAAINMRGQIKIWDIRSPTEDPSRTFVLSAEQIGLTCITQHPVQPHILCTGCADGVMAFWDLRMENYPVTLLTAHSQAVSEIHFHNHQPDHVFSSSQNGDVLHWNGSTLARSSAAAFLNFSNQGSQPIVPTPASGCVWLNSDAVKHRVETTSIMSRQPLPINSIDILGSSLLIAGDNEAIYLVENVVA